MNYESNAIKSMKNSFSRPKVVFDPSNKDHREEFYKFMKTGSWGKCKYQFESKDVGIPFINIQREILEYYLIQEFEGIE